MGFIPKFKAYKVMIEVLVLNLFWRWSMRIIDLETWHRRDHYQYFFVNMIIPISVYVRI